MTNLKNELKEELLYKQEQEIKRMKEKLQSIIRTAELELEALEKGIVSSTTSIDISGLIETKIVYQERRNTIALIEKL